MRDRDEDFQREWRLASWSVICMVAKEGFKNVRDDFETLAENEHDHNTNQNYSHIFVLFLLSSSGLIDFSWHFHCHTLPFLHRSSNSERNWHKYAIEVQSKGKLVFYNSQLLFRSKTWYTKVWFISVWELSLYHFHSGLNPSQNPKCSFP